MNDTSGPTEPPDCRLLTGNPDDDAYDEGLYCPATWDSLMCWPRTRTGSVAVQPCFGEFRGLRYDISQNASKWCWPNGTWNRYTNYTLCRQLQQSMPPPELHSGVEMLTRLYFIGYGASLATLIIAVAIYLYYRELRCLRNVIHMNLMLTYILADALWMMTTLSQISLESNIPMCIVFFSLYHYFQLTNYFWMFVEGLYLYVLVVKTFSGDNIKLKMCLFIGWGMPLLVVAVWAIAKSLVRDYDTSTMGIQEAALVEHCPWMVPHPFDWFYEAPAIFVLGVNVIFLFMIMWVLITKLRSATNAETQQYRKAAKALLVLIPLLGVTYILVLAGPTEGHAGNIFAYTRAVLLSSQGLSVAFFYCFLNSEVRNSLRHHYERWSNERSLGAGQRYYAHWGRRSHTESIRLYCRPTTNNCTSASIGPTTTIINNNNNCNSNHNHHHHHHHCAIAPETTEESSQYLSEAAAGC